MLVNKKKESNVVKYKDVKSENFRNKTRHYTYKDDKKVLVVDCDVCFGGGSIIKPELKHLDELEWDFEDCPKCDGEMYIEKGE